MMNFVLSKLKSLFDINLNRTFNWPNSLKNTVDRLFQPILYLPSPFLYFGMCLF